MKTIAMLAAALNLTYLPQDAVETTTKDITYIKNVSTNAISVAHTATTNKVVNLILASNAKNNSIHVPYYQRPSYKWSMKKIGR